MGADSSHNTADGVGDDSLWSQVAIAQRVEHRSVGAQESAPAHTDCREYRNGVAIYPSVLNETWHQAQCSAYSSESGDRECHEMWVVESEEPFKHEVYLIGKGWKQFHTLIRRTVVSVGTFAEGEHHHERRDDEHTGDDGNTHIHSASSTVEQTVEQTDEYRLLRLPFPPLLFQRHSHGHTEGKSSV